jgi:superfamily II DNA or RNA helicase
MPKRTSKSGSELFIVDNSDELWKVRKYLQDWCDLSKSIDIATGYFEIGSLLALDGEWPKVDAFRILMGDEVTLRTRSAFAASLRQIADRLDASLEAEKEKNDFLAGVPAIVAALRSGKIQCRVYRQDKFHAKCYLTHHRQEVVGSFALVGSSNFTYPGITENVELNVQISGTPVAVLQEWYEQHWNQAEDVTPEILRVIERHVREYSPYEVWCKALDEFFRGRELDADAWAQRKSKIYPRLSKYQRDAYRKLLEIAQRHQGALLCDGVGLGKTFVGLMLIERLVHDHKRVVLFAPKAAREDVWERALDSYLPELFSGFVDLKVFNHTDLARMGHWPRDIQRTIADADAVLIDEAHHFRNPGLKGQGAKSPSRYRKLQSYLHGSARPKQLFLLTATPVNNSIHDFRHMVELFTGADDAYFSAGARNLGVHNLRSHFVQLEKRLLGRLQNSAAPASQAAALDLSLENELAAAESALRADPVFDALVVQRSRAYVKDSLRQEGASEALFPQRAPPKVANYNLKKTYGKLLDMVRKAFKKERPLFVLGIYYPLAYYQGDKQDPEFQKFDEGRQKQVVTLIRTLFLKRFESSASAFAGSCWRLMKKLFAWATRYAESDHAQRRLERWKETHADLINYVREHQLEFWPEEAEEDEVEDFLDEDALADVRDLDPDLYRLDELFSDIVDDLEQLADFLQELQKVEPKNDDKLQALIKLLSTDPVLKANKVIVFTEFADTARYLETQLRAAGLAGLCRIDGQTSQRQRSDVVVRFSPYYNQSSSAELAAGGKEEIRVLIATDVLAEGLNLQDCTRLINYDLHWNPVRLMQRIGRVDRRLADEIESRLVADHPEQKELRRQVAFWNFLPPGELNELLSLYQRVTHKTLVISRTLGIEGRQLLTPDDDFDPVRELNEICDGTKSPIEDLRLEHERLLIEHPELAATLPRLPLRLFSGKESPREGTKAVFFCYRIPRPDPALLDEGGQPCWSDAAGITQWVLTDLAGEQIATDPAAIADLIRSLCDTPRLVRCEAATLQKLRAKIDRALTQTILKQLQAPVAVKPILKCWMELT